MIEKKLCRTNKEWNAFLKSVSHFGVKTYYSDVPEFPFIVVYESRSNITMLNFVTLSDFK